MADETHATARTLCADLLALVLPEPAWSDGALATSETTLYTADDGAPRCEIGLWEAHPGREETVEADEVFLVLAGSGQVAFDDGSSIELRRGVLVRLHEGDRTTWVITERLRKLYIA